jgi:hypothetical protein
MTPTTFEMPVEIQGLVGTLEAYRDATAKADKKETELESLHATRQKLVIRFADDYRANFGATSFASIRTGQGDKKGPMADAFAMQVAKLLLSAKEFATYADPLNHVTKMVDGKRVYGKAHNLKTRLNNWIKRLLDSAEPILKGETKVIEDADGNKTVAPRGKPETKPTMVQIELAAGEIIKKVTRDKGLTAPQMTRHDEARRIWEKALADFKALLK